jgi:hypothetical protein
MARARATIAGMMLAVAYIAIATAAVRTGDSIWVQWLFTMNLLLGAAVIAARVSGPRDSAFWTGLAVFEAMYLVAVFVMAAPADRSSPGNLFLVTTLWFREFALYGSPPPGVTPGGLVTPSFHDRINAMHLITAACVGLGGGLLGLWIAPVARGGGSARRMGE